MRTPNSSRRGDTHNTAPSGSRFDSDLEAIALRTRKKSLACIIGGIVVLLPILLIPHMRTNITSYVGPLLLILAGFGFLLVPFTVIGCANCGRKTKHYRVLGRPGGLLDMTLESPGDTTFRVYKCDECGARVKLPASTLTARGDE